MPPVPRKRKRGNLIAPYLASALDRSKISNRSAAYVIAATAKAIGEDIKYISLNPESIRRKSRSCRSQIMEEKKTSTQFPENLTVHWDGKLMNDLNPGTKRKVERISITISGAGNAILPKYNTLYNKILFYPYVPFRNDKIINITVEKIINGKGEGQARAVYKQLREWKVEMYVNSMQFDTTASKSGAKNCACVLLERKTGKILLPLACRHHILELVISKAFEVTVENVTKGPSVAIVQLLQKSWSTINKTNYKNALIDDKMYKDLNDKKNEILDFLHLQIICYHPRDDYNYYKELIRLIALFLGDNTLGTLINPLDGCRN